ncbi:ABC-type transport auxiliary lipoprotein family protein [Sphingobium aquiterrae]|uniref:ABC-type transport auxiliary lipoprotein family protein n=1 Tax=Sphingobium aquiterrae TaxID=2038656 RepID=UPI0030199DBD|tara:strand:- start:33 stop:701 length:669 start_codon:yes stop_codon:yes gene_type:complete
MKYMHAIRLSVLPALLIPLAACGAMLGGGKPDNLFRFGVPDREAAPSAAVPIEQKPVSLARIRFAPEIEGDRILTARAGSVLYIKDARWAAPAPDLFTQAMIRRFAERAAAIRLTPPRERPGNGLLLRLRVDRFEARYVPDAAKDAPPVILLSGTAELADLQSRRTVASRRFAVEEPASANGKTAIVAAFDSAVSRCTVDVVDWTAEVVARTSGLQAMEETE